MDELKKILQEYFLTAEDVAKDAKLSDARIRQLAPRMAEKGHSLKVGNQWQFRQSALQWVKNRHLYL